MRVVGLPKEFYHIARHPPLDLTPKAKERARYLSCWQALREKGFSSTEASHTIRLPRSTLYRWQKRLKEQGPQGAVRLRSDSDFVGGGEEPEAQTSPSANLESRAGPEGAAVTGAVSPLG